jgi:hypothetical protein
MGDGARTAGFRSRPGRWPAAHSRLPGVVVVAVMAAALGASACGPVEPSGQGGDQSPVATSSPSPVQTPSHPTPSPSSPITQTPTPTPSPTPIPTPTPTPVPTPTPTPTPPPPTPSPTPTPTPEPAEPAEPQLLERGDEGPAVLAVQQRLRDLGYWVGPVDGSFGLLTQQAVMAFQGWEEIARDGVVGPQTQAALADATRPTPQHGHANALEIDESRGVMLAVRNGEMAWAFHVSAGSYQTYVVDGSVRLADTPNGTWQIFRQIDGLREAPLGILYRPKYFHTAGIAVHGSPSVPAWGASHGCVRVTYAAIDFIWATGLAPIGTTVVVTGPTP